MALIIGLSAFAGIFILFLVLGKTLNNTINHLVKITYLLQKEFDLKKERVAIAQLLEEEKELPEPGNDEEIADGGVESGSNGSIDQKNNKKR